MEAEVEEPAPSGADSEPSTWARDQTEEVVVEAPQMVMIHL